MKPDEGVAAASEGKMGHQKWLNVQFTLTFLALSAGNSMCGGGSARAGWENVSSSLMFPTMCHNLCVCF